MFRGNEKIPGIHSMVNHLRIEHAAPAHRAAHPFAGNCVRHCARHALHHLRIDLLKVILPRLTAPIQTMPTVDHRHARRVGHHPTMVLYDVRLLGVGDYFHAELCEVPNLSLYDSTYTAIICLRRNSDVVRGYVDF